MPMLAGPRGSPMDHAPFNHHRLHRQDVCDFESSAAAVAFFELHQHFLSRYSEPLELTSNSVLSCPLDLSLKSSRDTQQTSAAPITPPCTPSPGKRSPENVHGRRTPTPEPPPKKQHRTQLTGTTPGKRVKATRKLNFDEDNSSPVSGTIIRELGPDEHLVVRKGDIDPAFNVVEITEEAKAELAKIENLIGDYVCRLCKELYEDAFGLAQHRCSRIVHVEYRCPECDKVFNCPANLASHRRWHRPRPPKDPSGGGGGQCKQEQADIIGSGDSDSTGEQHPCLDCGKRFRRLAYLRKHQAVHRDSNSNSLAGLTTISPLREGD
nr:unnamed protein product [Callosobruchus analis]